METIKLKEEENYIREYVNRFSQYLGGDNKPIYDGIVDEEKYCSSKYRIAWILKEPYDETDGTGGDWSLSKDILAQNNLYPDIIKKSPTFHTMAYLTHAILDQVAEYQGMDYIRNDPSIAQSLNNIALVNVNKMPAFSTSNDKEISVWYDFWKPILHW